MSRRHESAPAVLVMAGGAGRRLGRLTTTLPKPMLPVLGRPFLRGVIERLREQGIHRVHIAVHHHAAVIHDHFGDGHDLGMHLEYIVEREPLGTAGALGLMPRGRRPVLVINGDVAAHIPVKEIIQSHRMSGVDITAGLGEHRVEVPFGVVETVSGRVATVSEKPTMTYAVLAGVYVVSASIAHTVALDRPTDMPELLGRALQSRGVGGFPLPGPWLDIGTVDAYALAAEVESRIAAGADRRETADTAHQPVRIPLSANDLQPA